MNVINFQIPNHWTYFLTKFSIDVQNLASAPLITSQALNSQQTRPGSLGTRLTRPSFKTCIKSPVLAYICWVLRSTRYNLITFHGCRGNQLQPQIAKDTAFNMSKIKTTVSSGVVDASNDAAPPLSFCFKCLAGFQGMNCDLNHKKESFPNACMHLSTHGLQ